MTMKDISTITNKDTNSRKIKFSKLVFPCSTFTILLICCILYLTASAFISLTKAVSHIAKIEISKSLRDEAKAQNCELKTMLNEYTKLKQNEYLVRIVQPKLKYDNNFNEFPIIYETETMLH